MPTMQIASPAGFGGLIQGAYGNYQQSTDGSYTVDARDVPPLLTKGFTYVRQTSQAYTLPAAPAAATIGAIVASGALSNGTVAITANPDVPRPVNVEWDAGTIALSAGSIAVTYIGNDGVSGTDTISLIAALSTATTVGLSRGVVTISSIVVSGLVGGHSPWLRLSTTAGVSVPVAAGAIDVNFQREYDDGATIAIGTVASALASIAPTTAPNGTHTFSFVYDYVSPTS